MRKRMCVHLPTFIKALEGLGYRKHKEPNRSEWKHGKFHIIVNQSKKHVNVSLHVDVPGYKVGVPGYKVGPIHRSRQHGRDISEEFERVRKEYNRLRDSVMRK